MNVHFASFDATGGQSRAIIIYVRQYVFRVVLYVRRSCEGREGFEIFLNNSKSLARFDRFDLCKFCYKREHTRPRLDRFL